MDGTGCSAGRFSIHSAMASFMRGASAGQKNSGRGCGQEVTRLELGPPLGIMSQVRQVLRQGWSPLLPGYQLRTLRQVEGVDPFKLSAQAAKALLFPSFGLRAFMPLREIGQMLSRPVNLRLSSWETGPCLSMLGSLAPVGSSGHRLLCSFLFPGLPGAILAGGSLARVRL